MTKKKKEATDAAPKFKSDKSWGGKNILTGEAVQPKETSQNWTRQWSVTEFTEDGVEEVAVYRDGKEIARWRPSGFGRASENS
jgi:hypothetical protein